MLPELFCEKMKALLGDEYEAFLAALDRPRAAGLRINPLKVDITQIWPQGSAGWPQGSAGWPQGSAGWPQGSAATTGEATGERPRRSAGWPQGSAGWPQGSAATTAGSVSALLTSYLLLITSARVPWCPTGFYYDPSARPGLHPYHAAGAYYLQEPSAMAPAELLDPRPGELVLDLCAAPGGKSTQIAGKLAGEGLLVCNEIHPKRAAILASNVERMGIPNALVLNERPDRLAERFPGAFDRVLVDAPCSGEGMFRKHDAAFEDWSPETVAMCARRQAEILDSAGVLLRPGGRLVYSTCTFSPEENEGTVAAFLERNPEFSVERIETELFAPGRPAWADGNPELSKTFRLWPHRLKGEGHFAAVLRKNAAGAANGRPPEAEASRFLSPAAACGRPMAAPAHRSANDPALPKPVTALLKDLGLVLPEGRPVIFGDRVFWGPPGLPDLRGLKVLRPGLELAELRRELAVPAHALALWTKTAASVCPLTADDPAVAAYLRGETLPAAEKGWTLVTVDGLSLGWGKGANGVLKNHYPKGLRISSLQI